MLGSQLLTESGFILNDALVNGGFGLAGRAISMAVPLITIQNNHQCGTRIASGKCILQMGSLHEKKICFLLCYAGCQKNIGY